MQGKASNTGIVGTTGILGNSGICWQHRYSLS